MSFPVPVPVIAQTQARESTSRFAIAGPGEMNRNARSRWPGLIAPVW